MNVNYHADACLFAVLSHKMDVEMCESECRIAEFKTQLGKSELDSYETANSMEITHDVSMVVHDDLPLNW